MRFSPEVITSRVGMEDEVDNEYPFERVGAFGSCQRLNNI